MAKQCTHLEEIADVTPSAKGCEECLKAGGWWVHLRMCMVCGHMGCCDSSPGKHATKHFHATSHPIMRSMEPHEDWDGVLWMRSSWSFLRAAVAC